MTEPTVTRRQVWAEVGLNLVVRAVWAALFFGAGTAIHTIHANAWALMLFTVGTLLFLAAALLVEYWRAVVRLRRIPTPAAAKQTIGELHDDLPEGEWVYMPEFGVRVKKVAGMHTVTIDGVGDCP